MALRMLERGGQGPPALLALPLFVFANAFVGYLAVRTLLLARTGRLLSADCPATAVTRGPRAVGCGAVLAQACGDYVADDPCACVVIRRAKGSSSPALRSRPAAPIDVSSGRSRLPRFRCVGPDFPESRARPSSPTVPTHVRVPHARLLDRRRPDHPDRHPPGRRQRRRHRPRLPRPATQAAQDGHHLRHRRGHPAARDPDRVCIGAAGHSLPQAGRRRPAGVDRRQAAGSAGRGRRPLQHPVQRQAVGRGQDSDRGGPGDVGRQRAGHRGRRRERRPAPAVSGDLRPARSCSS
jgi:hypothetical protein